jgi:Protein of unknown function (DUF3800)
MARQRLYIDESGDHTTTGFTPVQWDKRYLCLLGCAMDIEYCRTSFTPDFEAFKARHFDCDVDDPVILHREDLKSKRGPFRCLTDSAKNVAFNRELLELVDQTRFVVFAVVIDKLNTHGRYFGPISPHPYHVGLLAMLERYCGWIKFSRHSGDTLAESRGAREDLLLKSAYQGVYSGGTGFRSRDFFQSALTTKEIKIKPKTQNICALQLADLLAYPAKRQILEDCGFGPAPTGFTKQMANILEKKYNRRYANSQVRGYGKIVIS